jgi:chromosome segregation ATPase
VTLDKKDFQAIDAKFQSISTQINLIHRDMGKSDERIKFLEKAREDHKMELIDAIHHLETHNGRLGRIESTLVSIDKNVNELSVSTTGRISTITGGAQFFLSAFGLAIIIVIVKSFISL